MITISDINFCFWSTSNVQKKTDQKCTSGQPTSDSALHLLDNFEKVSDKANWTASGWQDSFSDLIKSSKSFLLNELLIWISYDFWISSLIHSDQLINSLHNHNLWKIYPSDQLNNSFWSDRRCFYVCSFPNNTSFRSVEPSGTCFWYCW